jgi:hypothetical protein
LFRFDLCVLPSVWSKRFHPVDEFQRQEIPGASVALHTSFRPPIVLPASATAALHYE